jgi:hypothetical protein
MSVQCFYLCIEIHILQKYKTNTNFKTTFLAEKHMAGYKFLFVTIHDLGQDMIGDATIRL